MKIQTILILTSVGVLSIFACKAKKTASEPASSGASVAKEPATAKIICTETVTYTKVKGIMDEHCANSCHSASNKAAGINLSTYDMVKEQARMVRFVASLKHEEYYSPMPKKSPKLSDSTIQVIECWIQNGMPN